MFSTQSIGSITRNGTHLMMFSIETKENRVVANGVFYDYDENTHIPSVAPTLCAEDAVLAVLDCTTETPSKVLLTFPGIREALEQIDGITLEASESIFTLKFDRQAIMSGVEEALSSDAGQSFLDECKAEAEARQADMLSTDMLSTDMLSTDMLSVLGELSDSIAELLSIQDEDLEADGEFE
jgi:hypothetical protein